MKDAFQKIKKVLRKISLETQKRMLSHYPPIWQWMNILLIGEEETPSKIWVLGIPKTEHASNEVVLKKMVNYT